MSDSPRITENEIAALAASVKAPESLHRRVQAMAEQAAAGPRPRRAWAPAGGWRIGLAAAAAAGLASAALAVSLPGGGSALTVDKAAAVALKPATLPAPAESSVNHAQLRASVEGVAFPYWRERFGWRSAGARVDSISGRSVRTVFYADTQGRWIGYAIASGRAPELSGSDVRWRGNVPYQVLTQDGATVVAWPRHGHLCVIAGRGVQAGTLLRLAGWSRPGASA